MRSIVFLAAVLLAACGASGDRCDKACRNYFTLHFWDDADRQIDKAPPDQRDALRKKKAEELDPRMQGELGMCVSQCREAAGNDEADCMIAAKTAKDIEACVPPGDDK